MEDRKPNELVVQHAGGYARVSRTSGALRKTTRHGMIWVTDDVVEASRPDVRSALDEPPGRLLCLCRNADCSNPEAALHTKSYAGISRRAERSIVAPASVVDYATASCSARGRGAGPA